MDLLAEFLLFAWVPLVLFLFWSMRDRRDTIIVAYLAGLLLLPLASYKMSPGIPLIQKTLVANVGVLLGILVFDSGRFHLLKPKWIDLPAAMFCLVPFASSISNGLGAHDGLSALVEAVTTWGIPYLVGRLYFADLPGLRKLALGTLVAGVLYLPPILLESRLAPQLHSWIFGIPGRASWETVDFMGPLRWKPAVFMDSALALTMFMTSATLCGYGLWSQGGLRRLWGVGARWWLLAALIGTLLGKTLGGITLLIAGVLSLWAMQRMRTPLLLLFLAGVSPLYISGRASGAWSGRELTAFIAENLSERRAGSLETRLTNEDMLLERALQRPFLGWSKWGRARIYNADQERDVSLTDGLWIILLGNQGLIGLVSYTLLLLLPPLLLLRRLPAAVWLHPAFAPAAIFATLVLLHAIDNLENAMFNPIFVLASGGLAGMAAACRARRGRVLPATSRNRPARLPVHGMT